MYLFANIDQFNTSEYCSKNATANSKEHDDHSEHDLVPCQLLPLKLKMKNTGKNKAQTGASQAAQQPHDKAKMRNGDGQEHTKSEE